MGEGRTRGSAAGGGLRCACVSWLVDALRSLFSGVERVVLRRPDRPTAAVPRERLTSEGVKAQRLAALRKKDPLLGAAIDALDLDLVD